jgi:hypothetical protein
MEDNRLDLNNSDMLPISSPALADSCVRLVCVSHWAPPGSAIDHLLAGRPDLLSRATAKGLRCALLYASGWLVRWYEGSEAAVDAEWQRLQADPDLRHTMVLHRSVGQPELREPVQFASLHAGEPGSDVARRLHWIAREREQGWHAEPSEVWQALCAPCRLGSEPTGILGRRDVLAVASDSNEAVDVVRALAHHHATQVAYQRYAGSDPVRRDVGAAYTDLASGRSAVLRVHGLSQRALGAGAVLLGLRQVDTLLLILGESNARNRWVLSEVDQFLQDLPQRPALHLVAHRDKAVPMVLDMVEQSTQRAQPAPAAPAGVQQFTGDNARATT